MVTETYNLDSFRDWINRVDQEGYTSLARILEKYAQSWKVDISQVGRYSVGIHPRAVDLERRRSAKKPIRTRPR